MRVLCLLCIFTIQLLDARPNEFKDPLAEMNNIGNIDGVVQTVSRLARSLENPASESGRVHVRVPRQIGGPPGPPGPYRCCTLSWSFIIINSGLYLATTATSIKKFLKIF